MSFIVTGNGAGTYTTLQLALAAIPTTLTQNTTITGNEDVVLTTTGLTIPAITTGSFRLKITFDVQTRKISATTATSVILVSNVTNNLTIDNCTISSALFTGTNTRSVLLNANISGFKATRVIFDGGAYAIGTATTFSGQLVDVEIADCSFKNLALGSIQIGVGSSFTAGDYTQPKSAYRVDTIAVRRCTFQDVQNQGDIPGAAAGTKAALSPNLTKCWGVTVEDCTINTTAQHGYYIGHSQQIAFRRNTCTGAAWQTSTRYAFWSENNYIVDMFNCLFYGNPTTNTGVYYTTSKTLQFINNTLYNTASGCLWCSGCLDIVLVANNIFIGSYFVRFLNSTAGLTFTNEFKASRNNYIYTTGNTTSMQVQVSSVTASMGNNSSTSFSDWKTNGYDAPNAYGSSYFLTSASPSGETGGSATSIFNMGAVAGKPDYSVKPSSQPFQKADKTVQPTISSQPVDIRKWNVRPEGRDQGAYDYNATDPAATHNPPVLTITSSAPTAIRNDTTLSFTASASLDSGATVSSWAWNFGDGSTSTSQNPTHKFTVEGNYNVTATVTDSNGLTDTKSVAITVYIDGVIVVGGYADGLIFSGNTALMDALTRIFKTSPTSAMTPLNSDVQIICKTTTIQKDFYFSAGETGNYKIDISVDMAYTGNVKCWIRSQSTENGLWIQGRSNISFTNFKFTSTSGLAGVRVTGGQSLKFYNCDFTDAQQGIYFNQTDGAEFFDCLFSRNSTAKIFMSTCTNMTFTRCSLTYDGTGAESAAATKQMVTCTTTTNFRFLDCTISGAGNWDIFIKGNQITDLEVSNCFIEKFKQQIFYFVNGPAGQYNAERVSIKNNLFKNSMIADASTGLFPGVSGGQRGSTEGFNFTTCFDCEISNNTFYEDRQGVANMRYFNVTGGSSNIRFYNNIYFIYDSVSANAGEINIYRISTAGITTAYNAFYADRNYYFYQDPTTPNSHIKWGNVDNVSRRKLSDAQAAYGVEPNSLELISGTKLTTIIDFTTLEPVAGSPVIGMGGSKLSEFDYDLNAHPSTGGTVGAKEFTKTAYSVTAASFIVTNMNVKAARAQYLSTGTSYNIPSRDVLNFRNYFSLFFKSYTWTISKSGFTKKAFVGSFNFEFDDLGTYTVALSAVKNDNSTLTTTKTNFFVVGNPRPVPDFNLSNYRPFVGDKIDFLNASLYGTSYEWTITNANTGTIEVFTTEDIIQKQFNTAGVYDVKLKVTNDVDNDFVEFKRTIHVNSAFGTPYMNWGTARNIYYIDEEIDIINQTRFNTRTDQTVWTLYNSDTGLPVYNNPQKNPTIRPNKLPAGDYDVMFEIANDTGSLKQFKRHAFCVLPLSKNATKFTKNCALTDRFTDLNGTDYDGVRIDGTTDSIAAGTIIELTGETRRVELTNLKGTAEAPIIVVPGQSVFEIKMNSFNGFHLAYCEHVVIAGQLNPSGSQYGFNIHNDTTGISVHASSSCVNAELLSTYIRVMGCELWNSGFTAMRMKTEPVGTFPQAWRGSGFIMYNTYMHDNFIHDTGGEGIYCGFTTAGSVSSYYTPSVPDVWGNPVSVIYAHPMYYSKAWRNDVQRTGWDGIQFGNAFKGAEIHDNILINTGVKNVANQGSGFSINNGFQGDIYNNMLDNNIIAQPYKGKTRFVANIVVNPYKNDAVYMIDDGSIPEFDLDKPVVNAIWGGQWDGVTYYNGSNTEIEFIQNTLVTNRMGIYYLGKQPSRNMAKISVYGNLVFYTVLSYSNYDPAKSPVAPVNMPQRKLVYTASETGAPLVDYTQVFQNEVRSLDNINDLQVSNILKLDASISPGSTISYVNTPEAKYADMVFKWNYLHEVFSAEGLQLKDSTGKMTVGAYSIPSYTGAKVDNTGRFLMKSGTTAENMSYRGEVGTITHDSEKNTIRVQDGVTYGGHAVAKESNQTGYCDLDSISKRLFFTRGVLTNQVDTPPPTPTVPGTPANLVATGGTNLVSLGWSLPNTGGSALTSIKVYRGTTSGSLTLLTTLAGNAVSYADTTTTNGTTYYYQVSAVNAIGEGVKTGEKSGMSQPASGDNARTWSVVSGASNPWNSVVPNQQGYMYTCPGYNNGNIDLYPATIFGHGLGQSSTIISEILTDGLPQLIQGGQDYPGMLIFCPQIPDSKNWSNATYFVAAYNWLIANYRVDPNRVTCAGLSLGAEGVWWQSRAAQIFSSLLICSGDGVVTGTQSGDNNMKSHPMQIIHGDDDTTVYLYQDGVTKTFGNSVANLNSQTNSKPRVPINFRVARNLGHSSSVWNDLCFDRTKAYPFDWLEWAFLWSKDKLQEATAHVVRLEAMVTAANYVKALFYYGTTVKKLVDALSSSSAKTLLVNRYTSAKASIDAWGLRYLISMSNVINDASSYYNALTVGEAGTTVTSLKDMAGGSPGNIGLGISTALTTATDKDYIIGSFYNYPYFIPEVDLLKGGFFVNGNGGEVKFTGLNQSKKYTIVVFGGYDKSAINDATPAELTSIVGTDVKILYTIFNTEFYSQHDNITPDTNGAITMQLKGCPNYTNSSLVTRTETGSKTTPLSNISSYKAGIDAYFAATIIFEHN